VTDLKLEDVKGIGPKTAEKLREKGIGTVEELATKRPEELAEILNISKKAAKLIVNDAKSMALDRALTIKTLKERLEYKKQRECLISTGSIALDNLLKGGVHTDAITILAGEYASGKTQLCKQLAVNTVKLGRKVAWIETESGTFSVDRILEIAKANGVEIDLEKDIFVIEARDITDPYKQFLAYELIDKWATENKVDLGLLVIDSFSAKFRSYFTGREMLPDRAAEEARHFGFLDYIASKYNCAVVMTCQVMDVPDPNLQLGAIVKTGTRKRIVGGNVLLHSGTYILMMHKVKMDEWELIVADAPDIPFKSVRFRILPSGIKDVRTR